ncbi:Inositol transporter 1 [Diplonema papillatum]|nr:Inositol transporter 1 [Diplonema papillatum]
MMFLYTLIGIASIGGILFGYDTGIVSGAMIQIKSDPHLYPKVGGFDLSEVMQEAVISITTVGAAVGSIASGPLNNRFGRKGVNMIAAAAFVPSCVAMAAAGTVAVLLVGRFAVGVAIGFAATTVPLYIAEAAPPESRGRLVTLNSICIVGGQVAASLVACAHDVCKTEYGWRWMLGWGAVPGVIMFFGFLLLPESPRWLASKDKVDLARACLQKIRPGRDAGSIESELHDIQAAVAEELSAAGTSFCTILSEKHILRALLLGCGLQCLQQITGINTVMYYTATILQSSDEATDLSPFDEKNVSATCLSAVVAFSQMVGVIIGMFLIDRFGRKQLLLASLAGVIVFLLVLGGVFVKTFPFTKALAAVSMCCYLLSFGTGMAAIPWVFNSEVYPLYARARCVGLATCVNWMSSFAISASFLSLSTALSTDRSHPREHPDTVFWLYAFFGVVGYVLLHKYMPETKGLALEEITELFKEGGAESYRQVEDPAENEARSEEEMDDFESVEFDAV